MPIFDGNLPYTNLHELNLDWIVKYLGQVKAKTDQIDNTIAEAEELLASANEIKNLFITPEMFGAKGDGSTDDSLALNQTVQFAIDNNISILLQPNKTYVTTGIVADKPFSLNGNGSTIKVLGASGIEIVPDYNVAYSYDAEDVIENIVFECGFASNGLTIEHMNNYILRNITIHEADNYGVKLINCYNCVLERIYIVDINEHGIMLMPFVGQGGTYGSNANTLIECRIEGYSRTPNYAGVYIGENCNGNTLLTCTIEFPYQYATSTTNYGLYLYKCSRNVFNNLWLEHNYTHVYLDTANYNTFVGGYFSLYGNNTRCVSYAKDCHVTFIDANYDGSLPVAYGGLNTLFIATGSAYYDITVDSQEFNAGCTILGADNNGVVSDVYKSYSMSSRMWGFVKLKGAYQNFSNIKYNSQYSRLHVDGTDFLDSANDGNPSIYHYNMYGNKQNGNIMPIFAGATSRRPSQPVSGLMYFDTTLQKPIWFYNNNWYDATGAQV